MSPSSWDSLSSASAPQTERRSSYYCQAAANARAATTVATASSSSPRRAARCMECGTTSAATTYEPVPYSHGQRCRGCAARRSAPAMSRAVDDLRIPVATRTPRAARAHRAKYF